MKRLGLLRHAKSDWDDVALRDFDRGLNNRGRKGAALIGRHICEHGPAWDLIVASPAERVRLTLDAAALSAPVRWEQQVYMADAQTLLDLVQRFPRGTDAVLIVGHNPGLQDLLLSLVAPDECNQMVSQAGEKFPTASYAVIELPIETWADCAPRQGKLVHFVRPRDLDPELGPER